MKSLINNINSLIKWKIKPLIRLFTLGLIGLLFSHNQTYAIEISPMLTNGSHNTYKEFPANLWFLLDDSGSMGLIYNNPSELRWIDFYIRYGFVPYNPNIKYQLPKGIDGKPMPLPPLGKIYLRPFEDNANQVPLKVTNINLTNVSYRNEHGFILPIESCLERETTPQRRQNCQIWLNYYRTRMDVLKSALSLNLFGEANREKTKNIRIGFTSLNNNIRNDIDAAQTLPTLPLYGAKGEANKERFNRWLFQLYARSGTPLRGKASELYHDIIKQSSKNNEGYSNQLNPFLSQLENTPEHNNIIRSCRRNYVILLSDGAWNTTQESVVTRNLSSPSYIKNSTTEEYDTLPDGKIYTPKSPYRKKLSFNFWEDSIPRTLSDIAFAGWKTDLDNDKSNNDLLAKRTLIDNKIPTLHGSPYWHPYNDPATWQHINTFTIGFDLPGDASVNPPVNRQTGIDPNFLADNFSWQIRVDNNQIDEDNTTKDLANAALAGRGRFYSVRNADDLSTAFDNIITIANSQNQQPQTLASGTLGGSNTSGWAYFSVFYNEGNFTGELLKQPIYNGTQNNCLPTDTTTLSKGKVCNTPTWKAGEILTTKYGKDPQLRRIITLARKRKNDDQVLTINDSIENLTTDNLGYLSLDFSAQSLTPRQKETLIKNMPRKLTHYFKDNNTRINKLIDYIKGDGSEEKTGLFRKRHYRYSNNSVKRNILGAIVHSSPTYSGVPKISSLHPKYQSDDYLNFVKRYLYDSNGQSACQEGCNNPIAKEDVEMIYVGANDGMLHAFKADTGEESFAYIPNAVYHNLPKLIEDNLATSFIDGNLSTQTVDLQTNGSGILWKKMLVGAMGGGAKGLFALDITNPKEIQDIAQWEYSDLESILYQKSQKSHEKINHLRSNIGNILAKPAMVQLSDGTWAVITGNGYNADSKKAALIAIDLATGKPIQELVLDNQYTNSQQENGLGGMFFAAFPGKDKKKGNRVDRAYAGDLQGNIWVFDLSKADKNGNIKVARDAPLYTAKRDDGTRQVITAAPLAQPHPTGKGYLVHFGTGSLFSANDPTQNNSQSIYAIWDNLQDGAVMKNQLRTVKFSSLSGEDNTTKGSTVVKTRTLAAGTPPINWEYHRGWFVDLLKGERAWQSPYLTYSSNNINAIGYNTIKYSFDKSKQQSCLSGGQEIQNWKMVFNAEDATQPLTSFGALDTYLDGHINSKDLIVNNQKLIVASAIQYQNQILFNPTQINLYKPLIPDADAEIFCTFATEITQTSNNNLLQQQICRSSKTSSWSQLR